jgi:hypothetical protein
MSGAGRLRSRGFHDAPAFAFRRGPRHQPFQLLLPQVGQAGVSEQPTSNSTSASHFPQW